MLFRSRKPRAQSLAAKVSKTWADFARTGCCDWPAYTAPKRTTMVFDDKFGADLGRTIDDPGQKVRAGQLYRVVVPPPSAAEPEAESIPLTIVHEDSDLIVIDKPAGLVVHPAAGHEHGTLVNALIAH